MEFLGRMHPLRHVAPVRKSQVQHAICDALCAILRPNALSDTPRRASWASESRGRRVQGTAMRAAAKACPMTCIWCAWLVAVQQMAEG